MCSILVACKWPMAPSLCQDNTSQLNQNREKKLDTCLAAFFIKGFIFTMGQTGRGCLSLGSGARPHDDGVESFFEFWLHAAGDDGGIRGTNVVGLANVQPILLMCCEKPGKSVF